MFCYSSPSIDPRTPTVFVHFLLLNILLRFPGFWISHLKSKAGLSAAMTSNSIPSPFFLTHQHPPHHEAAIRLAAVAARRHRHMPILHQQATRKGGQIRFTHRQSHCLEETFSSTRYLTPGQRRTLANRLSLTERQVGYSQISAGLKCSFN